MYFATNSISNGITIVALGSTDDPLAILLTRMCCAVLRMARSKVDILDRRYHGPVQGNRWWPL